MDDVELLRAVTRYRARAEELNAIADQMTTPEARMTCLDCAKLWSRMADNIEVSVVKILATVGDSVDEHGNRVRRS